MSEHECKQLEPWFPNTGNLKDGSKNGTPMLIMQFTNSPIAQHTFDSPITHLFLCKECGRTFITGSNKDNKRRTAATLRILNRKMKVKA